MRDGRDFVRRIGSQSMLEEMTQEEMLNKER